MKNRSDEMNVPRQHRYQDDSLPLGETTAVPLQERLNQPPDHRGYGFGREEFSYTDPGRERRCENDCIISLFPGGRR